MAEHALVVRVTTVVPADGRRDDVLDACRQLSAAALGADGCFGAQVCDVREQPGAVAVVSRWRDQPSLDAFVSARAADMVEVHGLLAGEAVTVHYVSAG